MTTHDDWPFDQAPNVAAVSDVHVTDHGAPVLVVVHYDDDDSWAFLCGASFDPKHAKLIGMGTALRLDPTIREVADLAPGWSAARESVGAPWSRNRGSRNRDA